MTSLQIVFWSSNPGYPIAKEFAEYPKRQNSISFFFLELIFPLCDYYWRPSVGNSLGVWLIFPKTKGKSILECLSSNLADIDLV